MNGSMCCRNEIKAGQIRYVSLAGEVALQGGVRPALIIQNEKGCIYSPRIWVIPATTKTDKAKHLPVHVFVERSEINNLKSNSVFLVEQARNVLREDIKGLVGYLEDEYVYQCGDAWIKNCNVDIFSPEIRRVLRTDYSSKAIPKSLVFA